MADTDFVQRLRMNNIFPSGSSNPFSAPTIGGGGGGGGIDHIMNSVINFRNQQRQMDADAEENRYYRAKGDRLAEVARNAALNKQMMQSNTGPSGPNGMPLNVVLAQDPDKITAYQKAQLALSREKNELGENKLNQAGQLGERKLDISQQRANTYGSMHNLSDREKLDIVNRARAGDIQARGQLQQMIQEEQDDAAMDRTNVQQSGATQRNRETIKGAGERNDATIAGGIERDKSKAVGDYIFKNPADKPGTTTSTERSVTQGDADPIITKTTTSKGNSPLYTNKPQEPKFPGITVNPGGSATPPAKPAASSGGKVQVMVNGKPMSIDDYNADPDMQGGSSDAKKNAAIQVLQQAGKPVTPANIDHIMKQM